MRAISAFVLGLLACAGVALAQDDFAKKIVGKWEITKPGGGAEKGSVVEFTKDGKVSGTVKSEGQDLKMEGTYTVAKDQLELKVKVLDMPVERTVTIKELTDTELKLESKDKKVDEFKKVKDKK